ncbi:MAG: hypothetical protein GW911_32550, partial [Armatimonadetes bacterium]|nr:hypothetical protein [Armatimonadota bacterium]
GDLDGMMGIIRVVTDMSVRCKYAKVLDEMADVAAPVAQGAGRWDLLGELYACRTRSTWHVSMNPGAWAFWWPCGPVRQGFHFGRLAKETCAKAGRDLPLTQLMESIQEWDTKLLLDEPKLREEFLRNVGSERAAIIERAGEAQANGRDREAVSAVVDLLMLPLVTATTETDRNWWMLYHVAPLARLRTGERLLPLLQRAAVANAGAGALAQTFVLNLSRACACAWGGANDANRDAFYWCLDRADARAFAGMGPALVVFSEKLDVFGRTRECLGLSRRILTLTAQLPADLQEKVTQQFAAQCVFSSTPAELRRGLVRLTLAATVAKPGYFVYRQGDLRDLVHRAPPGQEAVWAFETGVQLLNAAVQFPDDQERLAGVTQAAEFLEQSGRQDLGEQARRLAASLAKNDPQAVLTCVLSSATAAAAEGRWVDVEKQLGAATGAAGPSGGRSALDAMLLLHRAKRALGKQAEADACLSRALTWFSQANLNPSQRVAYLRDFASLAAGTAQSATLLEQAKAAAQSAGLEVMVDKLTQQLAELSLGSGNLGSTKQALQDLVKQQEAKRERLAFDPLLRQQWFADNLSTYRKLLTVAAKMDDAPLALETAEKLRSRALLDQLAWR